MLRFAVAVLMVLTLSALTALSAGADDGGGIGTVGGPFDSSFVDGGGVAENAVCNETTRIQLDNGSHYEKAHCRFLPGAVLPKTGVVSYDNVSSHYDFWSDYTYELTGELELSTSWRVYVYPDGTVYAESTYTGLDPLFPGWIGSVIPLANGRVIMLSTEGLQSQVLSGIADETIAATFKDGVQFQYLEAGKVRVGVWDPSTRVLISLPDGGKLATVTYSDQASVNALTRP